MTEHATLRPLHDAEAFGRAYRAHSRSILIFLTRRTYDPETALDLTAETFAQAYLSRKRFRGSTDDELAAWLFAIARHVLARFLRRGQAERRALERLDVEVPSLEPDEIVRIIDLAGLEQIRGAVADGLSALPEDHREALRLRVVEELPYADVAERLGVSGQAARARVSRGLRALGAALDELAIPQEAI